MTNDDIKESEVNEMTLAFEKIAHGKDTAIVIASILDLLDSAFDSLKERASEDYLESVLNNTKDSLNLMCLSYTPKKPLNILSECNKIEDECTAVMIGKNAWPASKMRR